MTEENQAVHKIEITISDERWKILQNVAGMLNLSLEDVVTRIVHQASFEVEGNIGWELGKEVQLLADANECSHEEMIFALFLEGLRIKSAELGEEIKALYRCYKK